MRSVEKHGQLVEVVRKFDLYSQFLTFSRCITCKTELVPIEKESFRNRIDPEVYHCFDAFTYCPECDKIFWKGSHYERMEHLILGKVPTPFTGKEVSPFICAKRFFL